MTFAQILRAWAIIAVAMIANGIFRELVIKPAIGPQPAETASAVLGIAIIALLSRLLLRRLVGQPVSSLATASATLVLLTVAFEFLFGHYVDGRSWEALLENYAIWRGRLWLVVLLWVALMPFVWGRWLARPSRRAASI